MRNDIVENLMCGMIEILVLSLLNKEDMYGYQIIQEIKRISDNLVDLKEGSLYGPLYKMEEKKFISLRKELVGKRRFRNYYHIEDLGKEYLSFLLNQYNETTNGFKKIINWDGKR